MPILRGPLRGSWWLITRGQPARVILGTYEPAHTNLLGRIAAPGMIVLDVGAHTGYYSLLLARLVGEPGTVWAFEPHPINCAYLRRHVRMNRLTNVRIEELAVSDEQGTVGFKPGTGSGTGKLAADGPMEVQSVSIDGFCARASIRPALIKLDVEGAELSALRGAHRILESDRPSLVISTHGEEVHRECVRLLRGLEYRLEPITGEDIEATTELFATPV